MRAHGLVLVDREDGCWLTFCRPWWDLASWLWWLLAPGETAWVLCRTGSGGRLRIRAKRVASAHARIGTPPGGGARS